MAYEYISNHYERALARLCSVFRDKPKIAALIKGFASQIQDVENNINRMLNLLNIDRAQGIWLERIGIIVDEPRLGREDNEYRRFIKAKIAINNSKGTINEVLDIFSLLINCEDVHLSEVPLRVIELQAGCNFAYEIYCPEEPCFGFEDNLDAAPFGEINDPDIGGFWVEFLEFDTDQLYNIMDSVLKAGVRIDLLSYYNEGDVFGFNDQPDALPFGEINDDSAGGHWAESIARNN